MITAAAAAAAADTAATAGGKNPLKLKPHRTKAKNPVGSMNRQDFVVLACGAKSKAA